jgi:hypothetical protein
MIGRKKTHKTQKGMSLACWHNDLLCLWCSSWPIFVPGALPLCIILLFAAGAPAQEEGSAKQPGKKAVAKKDAKESPITAETEAAANAFIAEHHPELAELLQRLKGMKNQRPYQRAIRELSAVSERLANLQKNDPARYEVALKGWKVKSRIQLLSARLTMKDDDQLKADLKEALSEQYDLRREMLTMEKNRIQDRLQKLEHDLADYDSRREEAIEKQFKQLTTVPKNRPAAKSKTEKSTRSKSTTGS